MLKKTIKYKDFNGKEREEDFYFNLSNTEVTRLEASTRIGLDKTLQKYLEEKDFENIIKTYEMIILLAYGEKSEDGSYFIKKDSNGNSLSDKFAQTAAYDALFTELLTDENAAFNFITSIIPNGDKIDKDEISKIAKDSFYDGLIDSENK